MDSPVFDAPYSIAIEHHTNIKVIKIAKVNEIAFLGNNQIVVNGADKRPCVINLDSQECSYFSGALIPFKCYLATDQSKKRILFSRQDDYAKVRIYDSISKEFTSVQINYDVEPGKYFPIYFDEHKPTSILVGKGHPLPIVSYNYDTHETSPESCLSEGWMDPSMKNFQYFYNSQSKIRGIIGECTDGFKIHYDSPQSIYCKIQRFDAIPTIQQRSYICAPDLSFIVYYALFHRIFKLSDLPENFRCNIGVDNGCYISYANGDKTTSALRRNGCVSIPCSMVMHPINNKVFAMMLARDKIIHYFNSQGIFLAEQKLPISDEKKFENEVETVHQVIDFSENGELLGAVYPNKIVVFEVPFEVQCGVERNSLIWMLWCLKNYQLDGKALPSDIVRLLLNSLKF